MGDLRSLKTLKYYTSMAVAIRLAGKTVLTDKDLAALLPTVVRPIDTQVLEECWSVCLRVFDRMGATGTVAKGPDMRREVRDEVSARIGGQPPSR
jgi:pyruvate carboxylase